MEIKDKKSPNLLVMLLAFRFKIERLQLELRGSQSEEAEPADSEDPAAGDESNGGDQGVLLTNDFRSLIRALDTASQL